DSYITERHSGGCTGYAADLLAVQHQLVAGLRLAVALQHAQTAVNPASVTLAGDWLLTRIAAFAEADVRFVEAGFCRQDAVVDLTAPAWGAGLHPPALEALPHHHF